MSGSTENDPLDELRRADPMPADRLPPASLARVRARVYEDVALMSNQDRPSRLSRTRLVAGGLGAALVLLIVVLSVPRGTSPGVVAPPSGTPPVSATQGPIIGPGAASCVEQYSPATLAHRGIALDGTVTAISGNDVTFHVNAAYHGVSTASITLTTTTGMTGTAITSVGGPTLSVGSRYLVSGEDHFIWACGFTQPYDSSTAATWAAAFGH